MKVYSDKEIIDCLRSRKSNVVHYLFDRYLPMVRQMLLTRGGTAEDAKDIFQDVLLIMLQKIDQGDFVLTCKFKTFFYCVCENLWKTVLTKRQASSNYLSRRIEDPTDQDFSEIYDNKLYEHMFYDMFETLGPTCKTILKLYWEEYSPLEIAEKLGYSYGYVRKKKCECQRELITKIKNLQDYKLIQKSRETANIILNE